jgi:hypothetical protein
MRYRKKPVEIEARRLTNTNGGDIARWCSGMLRGGDAFTGEGGSVTIDTLEGRMTARVGDWVIQGVKGEYYPCKPEIFEATYEAAEPVPTTS